MLAVSCALLGVAVAALAVVCMNLTRRLSSIERLFLAAAERLGDAQYE